jgi:hypothetical protein
MQSFSGTQSRGPPPEAAVGITKVLLHDGEVLEGRRHFFLKREQYAFSLLSGGMGHGGEAGQEDTGIETEGQNRSSSRIWRMVLTAGVVWLGRASRSLSGSAADPAPCAVAARVPPSCRGG